MERQQQLYEVAVGPMLYANYFLLSVMWSLLRLSNWWTTLYSALNGKGIS